MANPETNGSWNVSVAVQGDQTSTDTFTVRQGATARIRFSGTGADAGAIILIDNPQRETRYAINERRPLTITTPRPIGSLPGEAVNGDEIFYEVDGWPYGPHALTIDQSVGLTILDYFKTWKENPDAPRNETRPGSSFSVIIGGSASTTIQPPSSTISRPSTSSSVSTPKDDQSPDNTAVIAGGVAGGAAGILVFTIILFFYLRKKRKATAPVPVQPFDALNNPYGPSVQGRLESFRFPPPTTSQGQAVDMQHYNSHPPPVSYHPAKHRMHRHGPSQGTSTTSGNAASATSDLSRPVFASPSPQHMGAYSAAGATPSHAGHQSHGGHRPPDYDSLYAHSSSTRS